MHKVVVTLLLCWKLWTKQSTRGRVDDDNELWEWLVMHPLELVIDHNRSIRERNMRIMDDIVFP